MGSFECSCNIGYRLDDNGRNCSGRYAVIYVMAMAIAIESTYLKGPKYSTTIGQDVVTNSAFTLATSEPCQNGLVPFQKLILVEQLVLPVSLLISAFKNGTKPVWHGSKVASVNILLFTSYQIIEQNVI